MTELCQTLGATTRRDFEGTSLDTLRQMVVMGMGITFLPSLYVASEIRETDPLRVTDVSGVNMYRDHALAWRTRSSVAPVLGSSSRIVCASRRNKGRAGERVRQASA